MKSFCGNFKGEQRCSPAFFFSLSPGGVFLVPGKAECRDGFPFPLLNERTVGSKIIFLELKVSGWWQRAEWCLVNPLSPPPIWLCRNKFSLQDVTHFTPKCRWKQLSTPKMSVPLLYLQKDPKMIRSENLPWGRGQEGEVPWPPQCVLN